MSMKCCFDIYYQCAALFRSDPEGECQPKELVQAKTDTELVRTGAGTNVLSWCWCSHTRLVLNAAGKKIFASGQRKIELDWYGLVWYEGELTKRASALSLRKKIYFGFLNSPFQGIHVIFHLPFGFCVYFQAQFFLALWTSVNCGYNLSNCN